MDALTLVRMRYREPYRDQLAILDALTELDLAAYTLGSPRGISRRGAASNAAV